MAARSIILGITAQQSGSDDLPHHTQFNPQANLPELSTPSEPSYTMIPFPPPYPPPHSQNSPAFFALSCVIAPQIEPEDLHFALAEVLAEQESSGEGEVEEGANSLGLASQSTGLNNVEMEDQDTDSHASGVLPSGPSHTADIDVNENEGYEVLEEDYESDSSEENTMDYWYASRNYDVDRREQTERSLQARQLDLILDYLLVDEGSDWEDDIESEDEDENEDEHQSESEDEDNHLEWLVGMGKGGDITVC